MFVLDNEDLMQKLVCRGVLEDCVCSCSTNTGIHSSLKHMQMEEKIPDYPGSCVIGRYFTRSASVETGCAPAAVACRAFEILNPLEQGLKQLILPWFMEYSGLIGADSQFPPVRDYQFHQ